MDILLRESSFGRLLNMVSNGRLFPDRDLDISKHEETTSSSSSTSLGDARHILVDFSGPEDPDMPRNWPTLAKTVVMVDVMLLNFSFYAASAIFTPSIPRIEEVFGATTAEATLGLSLFVIAYGIGPLILSPLSNLPSIGRTPVYVLGSLAFCLFNIGTALAKNLHTVLILRFFGGFIGSAPISVGGATLMEVYGPTEIPYAIALYAVSGVCGPILGPIIGTLVIERWNTWTATLWLLSGVTAFTTIFIFVLLPETLYSNILLRRAQRLRNQTGNPSYQSPADLDTPESNLAIRILKQTIDDFKLSCMDPVILFVNMHTMLIYGVLYLWFEFFPFVFDGIYHFTAIQQGRRYSSSLLKTHLNCFPVAFFGILVGAVISVIVYVLWLYFSYQPRVAKPDAIVEPEARLVPGQVGAICIPVCLFMFAWTSRESVHWIVPIIGTAFFAPGFYLTFQSILNYLGESYPRYVASVFAGNTFFRSSFGGALPLAAPRMLQSLGIGWASSTLGFISIAMVPLPFILERYGKRLRSWSKYAN
ncbi:major facilitator superfamily domain-containing protein [Aspergillus pseudotamarii]|uniref:Major facilitator superfamily domain-containing protein n=1 Tax=Aspergillus pseudotamarii TaxID=132259 RepID=A0A5N6SIE1_ASPPS|nr:major facilitator superfamily domain-containing protein [Aspergillus pseudotamarii]KAE8134452.1 major facilitator superfamily domain-containing protein [Aspergillus pseudotamarii]